MSIQIITPEHQAAGEFDFGRIKERKPIGFPQDGGEITPYSTLFYWAHAWSGLGGMIGEHPHRGFEIMSVVLTGNIEHYDSQLKGWKKLSAGDVQLIRSGNGITHAERIHADSSIFQIWFDPNLQQALGKPASYNDYKGSSLPVFEDEDTKARIIFGGTEVQMDSEIGYIQDIEFKKSSKSFPLETNSIYSFFLLEGSTNINGKKSEKGDYVIVREETALNFTEIEKGTKIFIIKSPVKPSYKTYADMM